MDLDKIRKEIDKVSGEMVTSFERRMELVKEVAEYKIANGLDTLDRKRESELIEKLTEIIGTEYKDYTVEFLESLFAISRKMQNKMMSSVKIEENETVIDPSLPLVAYLGVPGSFSETAVTEYFKNGANTVSFSSFDEIVSKVEKGEVDRAVIPVENSSTGSVNQSVDLLVDHDVKIVGEHIVRVRHFLLGAKGSSIGYVKQVISHPQALEQCQDYIQKRGLDPVPRQSTAQAAEEVAKKGEITLAAIASERAGEIYGLDILASDIQTNDHNYTRFVVLAKEDEPDASADKISVICSIEHKPGSLHGLIDIFSAHGLNLLQLFSRPIHNRPWEYCFHLDFAGNIADENVIKALNEAENYCTSLKMLGNYRSYDNGRI